MELIALHPDQCPQIDCYCISPRKPDVHYSLCLKGLSRKYGCFNQCPALFHEILNSSSKYRSEILQFLFLHRDEIDFHNLGQSYGSNILQYCEPFGGWTEDQIYYLLRAGAYVLTEYQTFNCPARFMKEYQWQFHQDCDAYLPKDLRDYILKFLFS